MVTRGILRSLFAVQLHHVLFFHKRRSLELFFEKEMQAGGQRLHLILNAGRNWRGQYLARGKFYIKHATMFARVLLISGILPRFCRESNRRKNAGILARQVFSGGRSIHVYKYTGRKYENVHLSTCLPFYLFTRE